MTRLPLDVRPVSTPRHPGAALSAFSTLGKPPGEPWARAAPAHAQNSVRATAAAINRLRPLETFMARCPPSGRGSPPRRGSRSNPDARSISGLKGHRRGLDGDRLDGVPEG